MSSLLTHTNIDSAERARVTVDSATCTNHEVPAELFGKFGEHLYSSWRVTNAFDAQILYNPTFGAWKFQDRQFVVDGGRVGITDRDEIDERIGEYVEAQDLPDADRLREAYWHGTALWWFPFGEEGAVRTSPDIGTAGDRAQRLEITASIDRPSGLAQWCYLPLHRTRSFDGRVTLRATGETDVRVALHEIDENSGTLGEPIAVDSVPAQEEYRTVSFDLGVQQAITNEYDTVFGCSISVMGSDANVVVDRLLVYPDDDVHTADPEIVDLFARIDLPVLRWPGGNFASGYHWRDGVGPIEDRPTQPNPAWDGIESNLFGTDEFVRMCDAIGCEPMICLNAGNGSPEEAARWVEYCNGSQDTEIGALRAAHGHPESYDIEYWEIGNELYGEWQISWTTSGGNADRFKRFRKAMKAVDPDIEVMACGNRLTTWNEPVLGVMEDGDWLTDHVLLECHANSETDPVELFNAHSGVAAQLGEEYNDIAEICHDGGLDPRMAITELQLFTRFDESDGGDNSETSLTRERLPTSDSITEAIFDVTIINQCIRDGIVQMVTHSGAGNHGGGIQKHKQRVWADPCLYALGMASAVIGGTPIGIEVASPTFSTETRFGSNTSRWFGELQPVCDEPTIDAVAVTDAIAHDLVVVLVHRDAGAGAIEVILEGQAFPDDAEEATVTTLTAETMYEANTITNPERITPSEERIPIDEDNTVIISISPYSIVTVTVDTR